MRLYRALGAEEALDVFVTGKVFPRKFGGSKDSTCPKGTVVSFWFDRPYRISGGRIAYAIADAPEPPSGVMSYKVYGRDYDGLSVLEGHGSVREYYLDYPVEVSVLSTCPSVLPGGDHWNRAEWAKEIDNAFLYAVDGDFIDAYSEAMSFLLDILFPEGERGEHSTARTPVFVSAGYGGEENFYVSTDLAKKAHETAKKYVSWVSEKVDTERLPIRKEK